jgi:predicted nucleotidyltransferase
VSPEVEQFRVLLRQCLPDLRQRYGVETLSLFGSYVRGEQQPQSDLDVLVEFAETPGLFAYVELQDTLSELLGIQVDLVMRSALKPRIARRVLPEVVAL